MWVSAAAGVTAGQLVDQPVEELEQLLRTNVVGAALSARAALQVFLEQGHGNLILVSSLLGVLPNPLVPTYVASKFAVRGLALSLRQDMSAHRSISVSCVLPGPIDTPLFQRAGNHTGHRLRAIAPAISPERVAATVVRCAHRPRRQVVVGVLPRFVLAAHRLAPRPVEWAAGAYAARAIIAPEPGAETSGALPAPVEPPGTVAGGWRRGTSRRRLGDRIGRWSARRGAVQ